MVESELKKTPGKDHVVLAVRPISNGVQVHLEVEQGLVRLFGRLGGHGHGAKSPVHGPRSREVSRFRP